MSSGADADDKLEEKKNFVAKLGKLVTREIKHTMTQVEGPGGTECQPNGWGSVSDRFYMNVRTDNMILTYQEQKSRCVKTGRSRG